MTAPADLGVFGDVDLWIFDLDNTLYPRSDAMWSQIDARMTGFIADLLGVGRDEAYRVQKGYLHEYGLSVRGLMLHHGVDPDAYNAHVHDVDLSSILPNPALGEAITALPGRRVIHTNSDHGHTERVLGRLGIADVFDAVYDIKFTRYEPKPAAEPFAAVISAEGGSPQRAAMFEDAARNLAVPHRLGMRTVLVPTDCDWASHGADGAHVHFVADDLTGFVQALAAGKEAL